MEIIAYVRYGRYPAGIKCYKRKLIAESIKRKANHYQMTFNQSQGERFTDFIARMRNQTNQLISYSFHILDKDKWFETRVIEQHADNSTSFTFEIYKEDFILYNSSLEL